MKSLHLFVRLLPLLAFATVAPLARGEEPPAKAPVPAVTVPTFGNATCPIMGKPASMRLFTDTEQGRLYVCCMPCVPKIKKDVPLAFSTAFPVVQKVGNTICPVTNKALGKDAVTVLLQGHEIGLFNEAARAEAIANSQITLTKATMPRVSDLGNLTCPVTGTAVVNNAFCLIGDELVRLSSPAAVAEVRKDPVAQLAQAKAIVQAQQRATKEPASGAGGK